MAKRQRVQKNSDPTLQSLWRAALGKEGGIRLECKEEAEAKRLRFALYNAVRHLRDPEQVALADPGLVEAVQNCSISFETPTVLLVMDKQFSSIMGVVNKALEQYAIPVKSEVADAAALSQARLLEKLGATATAASQELSETDRELQERAKAQMDRYYGKQ